MNPKLAKVLTGLMSLFVLISIALWFGAFGLKGPEPVAHAHVDKPEQIKWSFDGPTGTFDQASIQRGYKVYKEVCASCHSMDLVSFRNLKGAGFSDAEIKALAAEYTYTAIGEDGSPVDRKGIPSDKFKHPYENAESAAAANGGAVPPDLSLMAKARMDGPNYIYSLLTGYSEPQHGIEVPAGKYFNRYFPGQVIAMPQPLKEGQVDYADGTPNTLEQQSKDVVNFLQYVAEPEMELRKRMGLKVIIFLTIATFFFYVAKVRIWARVK